MPHYYLQGLENDWSLVRETPNSQKFKVKTSDNIEVEVDVHFTSPKILTVNICFVTDNVNKTIMTPLLEDISHIALRRNDYAIIDYTFCCTNQLHDGNYTIDKNLRQIFDETL